MPIEQARKHYERFNEIVAQISKNSPTDKAIMAADQRRGETPAGHSQNTVNTMSYSMDGFAMQCVERYLELSGEDLSQLKPAPTPTLDDHQFPAQ